MNRSGPLLCSFKQALRESHFSGRATFASGAQAAKSSPAAPSYGVKKPKRGADTGSTPRQAAVIKLLSQFLPFEQSVSAPLRPSDEQLYASKLAAYNLHKARQHSLWMADMEMKHKLQRDALQALPMPQRRKAEEPDYSPFPPARKFLYNTPPRQYLEDTAQASKELKGPDSSGPRRKSGVAEAKSQQDSQ